MLAYLLALQLGIYEPPDVEAIPLEAAPVCLSTYDCDETGAELPPLEV